ncbi:hypothetical protein RirG_245560 [Rhizophagus irregularis DAOM 197198w]|uniref:Uncharacterized protein n=1 Tax=Rhizophagus irregularis (strain DAOM 197198w) TaxID=1432141 RepID=A0A015LEM7_RHIIW|nr:hypothetical protein RirG_245560 [Rhizophagus irregularis DAOM 197198w]
MTFILDIQSPPNLNQGGSSDLDDIDIRVKFITGLLPDNRKHVDEFGIKKPLKELVKYLVRDLMFSTKIRKYKIRELKQGNELV